MSMRTKLRAPLRVFLPDAPPDPPSAHVVRLTLYACDSLAFGYLSLSAGRVTDLMNEHEALEFVDTYLQNIAGGHGLALRAASIALEEICAVGVTGPRGDPKRRTRTRPIPVELGLGPYDVRGNIHVVPGTDPLASFRSRRAMVPLTEATIEWDAPGGRKIARWDTVVVNRLLTDWIAPATRDATEAAATRAIEDFLADHAEARAAESLSSENPKHPPTA
jgi:hypothetical protein